MKRILFVCLGNICRSPTGEGVFRKMAEEAGLADRFQIASAGIGGWHVGDLPDRRMRAAAKKRGYLLESRARQFDDADFEEFDRIIAMDRSVEHDLLERAPDEHRSKIALFEVPDPYYGGPEGFELVMDIVERGCRELLKDLAE